MATIIPFSARHHGYALCNCQLDAVRAGLTLLGADNARAFPLLAAALSKSAITHESGPLNGTASRNTVVTSVSSCA